VAPRRRLFLQARRDAPAEVAQPGDLAEVQGQVVEREDEAPEVARDGVEVPGGDAALARQQQEGRAEKRGGGEGGAPAGSPTATIGPRTARSQTTSKGSARLSITGRPAAMQAALMVSQSCPLRYTPRAKYRVNPPRPMARWLPSVVSASRM
jgi:uncharacterized Zn-binding protein involved in type VI secretion